MLSVEARSPTGPAEPVQVYCRGPRPDGGPGRHRLPLAEVYPDGTVIVREGGRRHNVTGGWTTCPRCKTRHEFVLNPALNQAGG